MSNKQRYADDICLLCQYKDVNKIEKQVNKDVLKVI